jgi:perosamine synthetase
MFKLAIQSIMKTTMERSNIYDCNGYTVKKLLAQFFNTTEQNIYLFAKGRVGLYAILKTLNISEGDKIIVPGYTCMVVPSSASFLGIECQYIDIKAETYNINPADLDKHLSEKTKGLIVQHTYGIPAPMDAILKWSEKNNVPIIEDCCHAFGSKYKGRLCGTFGVASFFSGQWNKPFSSGLGGMVLINEASLVPKMENVYAQTDDVTFLENIRLKVQIIAYNLIVSPRTNALITQLYRFLSQFGLTIGSSSPEELTGSMPPGYFQKMAPCQIEEGSRNLQQISTSIALRKINTAVYSEELTKIGFLPLQSDTDCEEVILRYPIRVANKNEVLRKALDHHLEIGSWFEVPLHPDGTDMAALGYREGMCPEAEKATKEVINLPTHDKITLGELKRIIKFLSKYARPVF